MTARNLFKPSRTPATQSRPMDSAAGGLIVRLVGSPAGGCWTAAVFSSFGAAACISIRSLRNRHVVSGAVRRLGFTPIPGRRSSARNSFSRGPVVMAGVDHAAIGDSAKKIGGVK